MERLARWAKGISRGAADGIQHRTSETEYVGAIKKDDDAIGQERGDRVCLVVCRLEYGCAAYWFAGICHQ